MEVLLMRSLFQMNINQVSKECSENDGTQLLQKPSKKVQRRH
jgi:hypothetical protein